MSEDHRYCARCGKPSNDGQYQWSAQPQPAAPVPPRRLERNMYDRRVAGVCSGFAQFFGMDTTMMRLLWVALTLVVGLPLLVYPVCWLVMPRNDLHPRGLPQYQQA